jgi:membrane-bound lytic murein transglycosylase D
VKRKELRRWDDARRVEPRSGAAADTRSAYPVRSLLQAASLCLLLGLIAGCSLLRESTTEKPLPPPVARDTASTEPLLPRPALPIDTLPPVPEVNLADHDALLDRVRLHVVLAGKALQAADTLASVEQCNLAAERLEQASYLPDIDSDTDFVQLSAALLATYQRCAPTILRQNIEIPSAVLNVLLTQQAVADSVDYTRLTFKEPPPTTIPLPLNEEVEKNLIYFTTRMRGVFGRWLERSGRYFPVLLPILREEGVPDELLYLTMIESGVNPLARSWAKCVGLWQFLKSTGEAYGLRGDWYFDDRRNPEKATRAAARHLRDLYNHFHDWHLALAAYNAGSGRIDRAVARSDAPNPSYWDIREFLPTETQQYVPRYIAASIIALNTDAYDFTAVERQSPLEYDVVTIDGPYSVEDLADCVGLTADEFADYNPHLLQSTTPPNAKGFEIRVPRGRKETFASNIVNVKPVQAPPLIAHTVKRGETIHKIARLYGMSVEQIRRANSMKHTRRLVPGEQLRIPRATGTDNVSYATAMDNMSNASAPDDLPDPTRNTRGREKTTVRVERGMTLGGIAERYRVSIADLMRWNSLRAQSVLQPGQPLTVWARSAQDTASIAEAPQAPDGERALTDEPEQSPPRAATVSTKSGKAVRHRVAKGETLAQIAEKNRVSVGDIVRWNELPSRSVRPGRVLLIYPPVPDAQQSLARAQREERKETKEERKENRNDSRHDKPAAESATQDAAVGAVENPAPATAENDEHAVATNGRHTVKSGETLWGISTRYGVKPADMQRWNSLDGDALRAGQVLVVSPPQENADERHVSPERLGKAEATAASHVVQKGESLWGIARALNVPVGELSAANNITNGVVHAGQVLAVPSRKAAPETAQADESRVHIVQSGETLSTIARAHRVSLDQLRTWNDLKSDVLRAGQQLALQAPAGEASRSVAQHTGSAAKDKPSKTYVVQQGDTLYSISKKLGVSVQDLSDWNRLGNTLQIGQELNYLE